MDFINDLYNMNVKNCFSCVSKSTPSFFYYTNTINLFRMALNKELY